MEDYVCILSFPRDENLTGRTYWYLSAFPLKEGSEVVAPLGIHNKLQVGKALKVYLKRGGELLSCGERVTEGLPVPEERLKRTICPLGDRAVKMNGVKNAIDLGGVFYDKKHVTAYGNFIRSALPEEKFPSDEADEAICFTQRKIAGAENFPRFIRSGSSHRDILSALKNTALMKDIFSYLSSSRGVTLICGEYGVGETDIIELVLNSLCGADSSAEDYRRAAANAARIYKKEFLPPFSVEEFYRAEKIFIKRYGGGEEYLKGIKLTEEEIEALKTRMTRTEF